MSIFNILLVICILLTVVMGVIIYMRNPRNKVNQIYTLLSFLVSLAGFVNYYISIAESAEQVYALLRMTSLRLFIFPVTVHFYLLLAGQKKLLKGYWIYILLYMFPTIIMFTTEPRGLFDVVLVDEKLGWSFYPKKTVVGSLLIFYIFSLTLLLFYLGFRYIHLNWKNRLRRIQGIYILVGLAGALVFPVIFDIALPLFSVQIPQIASLSFILGYLIIAHAVLEYDLFAPTPESSAEEILKSISDAVVLTDRQETITFVNKSATDLFGFEEALLVGQNIRKFIVPGGSERPDAVEKGSINETLITKKGNVPAIVSQTSLFPRSGKQSGQAYIIREITEIKNLIDRLAESETRYKNIFENIQNVYFEVSQEGKILEISPSVELETGLKREELLGKPMSDLYVGSESREHYWQIFQQSTGPVTMEIKLRNKSGGLEDGMLFVRLLRNGDGTPHKLVGNVTNISAVKKAEKLLAESEERYRLLFEKSPEGILLLKNLDDLLAVNEAAMEIVGASSLMDFKTRSLMDYVVPEEREIFLEKFSHLQSGEIDEFKGELRVIRPGGRHREVSYNVHKIFIGTEGFIQVMAHDITERKEAERKLIESEKRYSSLVDTSPDSITVINENFEVLMANPQTACFMGVPVDKLIGTRLNEYFDNKMITEERGTKFREIFRTGEVSPQMKVTMNSPAGKKWYSLIMVPLKDETNKVVNVMGICRDITQVEEAERQIRRNEEIYRLFLENFQGIAFRLNFDFKLDFIYGEVFELTGYTIQEFYEGIPKFRKVVHPEDRTAIIEALKRLRKESNAKTTVECRILHKNGSTKYIRAYLQTILDHEGKSRHFQGALFDKTDYYDLQDKVINSIIETEDRERQRFAEDLHDELGPLLSSVRIYINLIQSKGPLQEKERSELIDFAKQLLDEAVLQTRSISYNLMPEVLNQYGIISSIKSYCSRANIANKMNIVIHTDGMDEDARFDSNVEIALYRVAKELIHNSLKHSEASNIRLRFFIHNHLPALEYSDDGQGFDLKQKMESGTTLGIRNIFHRIQSVNGTVNFVSSPNRGVKVLIKF